MARYKYLNGVRVQMTTDEENSVIAKETAWNNDANNSVLNIKMKGLRNKRNQLLAETDFYANSDVTMSDAMRTYRQQLRDITNGLTTVEQVEAVEFPEKPLE